jgi:hypothetical protein
MLPDHVSHTASRQSLCAVPRHTIRSACCIRLSVTQKVPKLLYLWCSSLTAPLPFHPCGIFLQYFDPTFVPPTPPAGPSPVPPGALSVLNITELGELLTMQLAAFPVC